MKVGLFFVCGRNFIILPQKSVPSLLKLQQLDNAKPFKTNCFKNVLFTNVRIMHQPIPAAPIPPPPRANPRALAFFLSWVANSRGWGSDERRGQMPHPRDIVAYVLNAKYIHNHNDLSRSRFSVVA